MLGRTWEWAVRLSPSGPVLYLAAVTRLARCAGPWSWAWRLCGCSSLVKHTQLAAEDPIFLLISLTVDLVLGSSPDRNVVFCSALVCADKAVQ
jgi:hypothetical protein